MFFQDGKKHFQVLGTNLILTFVDENVEVVCVKEVHHICFFVFAFHLKSESIEHHLDPRVVTFSSQFFFDMIGNDPSVLLDDIVVLFPLTTFGL